MWAGALRRALVAKAAARERSTVGARGAGRRRRAGRDPGSWPATPEHHAEARRAPECLDVASGRMAEGAALSSLRSAPRELRSWRPLAPPLSRGRDGARHGAGAPGAPVSAWSWL